MGIKNNLFLYIHGHSVGNTMGKAIFNNSINNYHHIVHIHEMVITVHMST